MTAWEANMSHCACRWLLLHPTVAVYRVIRLVDCVGNKRMAVRRPAVWATGWGS